MTEQEMNRLREKLDDLEAQVDNMNRKLDELDEIIVEIEKHKQPKVFDNDL